LLSVPVQVVVGRTVSELTYNVYTDTSKARSMSASVGVPGANNSAGDSLADGLAGRQSSTSLLCQEQKNRSYRH